MKKLILGAFIALMAIGTISAQGWGRCPVLTGGQQVTVEGTLQLQNGHTALAVADRVYFVPFFGRIAGFVDGIREGAAVSVTGFVSGNFIHVTQFTVGGRSFDRFEGGLGGPGFWQGRGPGGGFPQGGPGFWQSRGPGGRFPQGGPGHHGGRRGGPRGGPRW